MNPDIVEKKPIFNWLLFVLIVLILGLGGYLYFQKGTFNFKQSKSPALLKTTLSTPSPTLSPKAKLASTIKQTFTSKETRDVISYLNRASAEKEASKSYSLYKQTFAEMSKAYTNTKNITYKYAMIDLKTFLITYPQYKEQEFKIPK